MNTEFGLQTDLFTLKMNKFIWKYKDYNTNDINNISEQFSVPKSIASIMSLRGINDKKISYLPGTKEDVKTAGSNLANFTNKYLSKEGLLQTPELYHRALSMAMNPDKYAKFFYEQGQADAVDNMAKKTKNIKMDIRSTPQVTAKSGFQVRSLNQNSGRG